MSGQYRYINMDCTAAAMAVMLEKIITIALWALVMIMIADWRIKKSKVGKNEKTRN